MRMLLGLIVLGLMGCTHGAGDRRLDDKLLHESSVTNQEELRGETRDLLALTKGLTDKQKEKLGTLREISYREMAAIRADTVKLRSILIQDIYSDKYDADEVYLVKSRIRTLDEKRTSLLFDMIDKANGIFGRQAELNRHVIRQLVENEGHFRR